MAAMKAFLAVLLFLVAGSRQDHDSYTVPLIKRDTDPSVLQVDDKYYMVTEDGSGSSKIPIYTSTNLKSWEFSNYVFTEKTFPTWADKAQDVSCQELHKIGCSYNVYFGTAKGGVHVIGVATASTPTGPFKDSGKPLWADPTGVPVYQPHLARDGKF